MYECAMAEGAFPMTAVSCLVQTGAAHHRIQFRHAHHTVNIDSVINLCIRYPELGDRLSGRNIATHRYQQSSRAELQLLFSFKIITSLAPGTDHHNVKMSRNMGDERMLLALNIHLRGTPKFYTRAVGWEHLPFSQTHTEHYSTLGIKHRANMLLPFHSCISMLIVPPPRQSCKSCTLLSPEFQGKKPVQLMFYRGCCGLLRCYLLILGIFITWTVLPDCAARH